MRRSRSLRFDPLDVVARVEDADRRIDVFKVDNQLPQRGASIDNASGDFRPLGYEAGKGVATMFGSVTPRPLTDPNAPAQIVALSGA